MQHKTFRVLVTAVIVLALGGSIATASASTPARAPAQPSADPIRILVTNDDGVGAAGIAALVNQLRLIPNSEVTVIAPATNQSGTGPNFTTTPITVSPATTASR